MTATLLRRSNPIVAVLALTLLSGCGTLNAINPFGGGKETKAPDVGQMSAEDLYNSGVENLRAGKYGQAVARFDLVQQNYPYSPWASSAQLMEGYANYTRTTRTRTRSRSSTITSRCTR